MDKVTLSANKRELLGRKVKKLRLEGKIPSNVYGNKVKSQSVVVVAKEFEKTYEKVGETGLVDLVIDGKSFPVLIHDVQKHPVSDKYLHIDFFQVNLKEKVKTQVPVEMIGESPAEKSGIGTAVQYLNEVEIEALPGDLPDKFEIDAAKLIDLESVILISDLKYDKTKVTMLDESTQILAKIEPPQEEVVEEPVVTEEAEGATKDATQTEDKSVGEEETTKEE